MSPGLVDAYLAAGLPADRIQLAPNGIDTTRFRPSNDEERRALRDPPGTPDRRRNRPVRRLLLSGQATACLLRRMASLFITPGALRRRCYSSARRNRSILKWTIGLSRIASRCRQPRRSGHVIFAGQTHDVQDYFRAADMFALPSRREGLPVALLEAMACGLPSCRVSPARIHGHDRGTRPRRACSFRLVMSPSSPPPWNVCCVIPPSPRRSAPPPGRPSCSGSRAPTRQAVDACVRSAGGRPTIVSRVIDRSRSRGINAVITRRTTWRRFTSRTSSASRRSTGTSSGRGTRRSCRRWRPRAPRAVPREHRRARSSCATCRGCASGFATGRRARAASARSGRTCSCSRRSCCRCRTRALRAGSTGSFWCTRSVAGCARPASPGRSSGRSCRRRSRTPHRPSRPGAHRLLLHRRLRLELAGGAAHPSAARRRCSVAPISCSSPPRSCASAPPRHRRESTSFRSASASTSFEAARLAARRPPADIAALTTADRRLRRRAASVGRSGSDRGGRRAPA